PAAATPPDKACHTLVAILTPSGVGCLAEPVPSAATTYEQCRNPTVEHVNSALEARRCSVPSPAPVGRTGPASAPLAAVAYRQGRSRTVEHVHAHGGELRVGGRAGVAARVGGRGVLHQQVGRGGGALLRHHRHAPARRVVRDHLLHAHATHVHTTSCVSRACEP
ncbi:jg25413, partial [Pararge aegeria aegeria]